MHERARKALEQALSRQGAIAKAGARVGGIFTMEIWRPVSAGRSGGFYYDLVSTDVFENIVTNEGLDKLNDSLLHNDASATWYCVIVETDTAAAAGMTYATPVYTECTAYDEATRPEYIDVVSSSQSITNTASKAVFTMNATKTIYGAALVDHSVKGNTAEANKVLLCYSKLTNSRDCFAADVVNLTYVFSSADDGV